MSTLPSSHAAPPKWKQEVNRRIAEHKTRKGISFVDEDESSEQQASANSRAAAAAARVAARYAKAPSYSELQAAEARAALRAAEAATRAAVEAQVAAQAVLHQLETSIEDHAPELQTYEAEESSWPTEVNVATEPVRNTGMEIRWEPDMPQRASQTEAYSGGRSDRAVRDYFDSAPMYEEIEAQVIPANLIHFPREIVATRRLRPRLAEGAVETDPSQLSIFEVDPNTVSTEPMVQDVEAGDPVWIGSSWQQMHLDEEPRDEHLPNYYALVPDEHKLYQAPFGRRMMAAVVDAGLIMGLVFGSIYLISSNVDTLPGKHAFEACALLAVLGFAALYEWFFLTYAKVTPGMRYAQLALCTFDEQIPTREQVNGRLKAMLISVLPIGLGMLWSIFDEDQMSWHDRLSKTYLRLS
ncbi:MAG: RDD family protein [Acidobacteria bacterium]|nr:RDD family protein [Acidobacteriota bacterium]